MTEPRPESTYTERLFIYILSFMIITVIGLIVFYDYLDAYELSQPYNAVDSYRNSLRMSGVPVGKLDAVTGVNRTVNDDGEILEAVKDILSDVEFSQYIGGGDSGEKTYLAFSDGENIGEVHFTESGETHLWNTAWALADESYDLSAFTNTVTVNVPKGYTVSVNGIALDDSCCVASNVRYKALEAYYSDYPDAPTMITMEAENVLGTPDVVVSSPSGSVSASGQPEEEFYLNSMLPAARRAEIASFVQEFVSNYVQFTADVGGGHYFYYTLINPVIEKDSPLSERIYQSLGSFGFTTTRSCEIISNSVNICCPLGKDTYLVDYSYTTDTSGNGSNIQDSCNVRIVVADVGGELMVRDMVFV